MKVIDLDLCISINGNGNSLNSLNMEGCAQCNALSCSECLGGYLLIEGKCSKMN